MLLVLLIVAVTITITILVTNRQRARQAAKMAAARGWRYTIPGWQEFFKPRFQVVGTTPDGAVWEIRRLWANRQLHYQWQAFSVPLPYGSVEILPAKNGVLPVGKPLTMTATSAPTEDWPAVYQLFTSHNRLALLFADEKLVTLLRQLPAPPQRGSLVRLTWKGRTLRIVCFYAEGWEVLERMVALGETLAGVARRAY